MPARAAPQNVVPRAAPSPCRSQATSPSGSARAARPLRRLDFPAQRQFLSATWYLMARAPRTSQ
eukprot:14954839-Alexandrium_andersonii.AAC.1